MMKAKLLFRCFTAIILLTLFTFAAVPNAEALMLISQKDEIRIGKQVEEDVIKRYGGLSEDRDLIQRVERVGSSVAANSKRKGIEFTFKVLNSKEINAFAAPGGPVLITKALAQKLDTDDELAFVLAHEVGHIEAQHGRKAINEALIASGIASILLRDANESARLGVDIIYTLHSRGYSRRNEFEADRYGVDFMIKSGYNPEGAIIALAKLGLDRVSGVSKYFSTHPDTPDRIDRVAKRAEVDNDRKKELILDVNPDAKV
ncbi:MAG: M48 family metalloprotease [Armatimonadota bacterium]